MKVFFLIYARDSTEILLCELSVHRRGKTVCRAGTANPYGDNYGLRLINTHDGVASRLITFLTSFGRSSSLMHGRPSLHM